MIDVRDIEKAAERLAAVIVRTPLLRNFELDNLAGGVVLIKPECLQVTGSFKTTTTLATNINNRHSLDAGHAGTQGGNR